MYLVVGFWNPHLKRVSEPNPYIFTANPYIFTVKTNIFTVNPYFFTAKTNIFTVNPFKDKKIFCKGYLRNENHSV